MKRVVISGMGLVSPLGNNKAETLQSLRETKSGIKFQPAYEEMGLRSHIAGSIDLDTSELIDRKLLRFMGDAAAFSYISMQEAIEDAGLTEEQVSNFRSGLVAPQISSRPVTFFGRGDSNELDHTASLVRWGLRFQPAWRQLSK